MIPFGMSTLLGHTIATTIITFIGDRNAQVFDFTIEGINEAVHGS
jgi:hypothetical protein